MVVVANCGGQIPLAGIVKNCMHLLQLGIRSIRMSRI